MQALPGNNASNKTKNKVQEIQFQYNMDTLFFLMTSFRCVHRYKSNPELIWTQNVLTDQLNNTQTQLRPSAETRRQKLQRQIINEGTVIVYF